MPLTREAPHSHLPLDQRLADALAGGELGFVYQPIVRTSDLQVVRVEALARLRTPDLRDLTPDVFLPSLFRLDKADAVTRATMRTTFADRERIANHFGCPDIGLSINLSSAQLRNGPSLIECVEEELADSGIDPRSVTFEIVEDLAVPHRSLVAGTLASLRRLGVLLALDDFGSGSSSHEHLLDLDVDSIKIDRRFITDASSNRVAKATAEALIGLGVSLDLHVVAEGVQSRVDINWLEGLGCHALQGWGVGMPVDLDPPAPESSQTASVATDAHGGNAIAREDEILIAALESNLLNGFRLSQAEAEAGLAVLDRVSDGRRDTHRIGWIRSWLLHVTSSGSMTVGDHVATATRSLHTGEVGQAGLEFSRAAVAACHSNDVTATLANITQTCDLLASRGWDQANRLRAVYNLTWLYSEVTRKPEGAELLAHLFGLTTNRLPDHLNWATGFNATLAALEVLELEEIEPSALGAAHPDLLLSRLGEMAESPDSDASLLWHRYPLAPAEIRWQLISPASGDLDIEALLMSSRSPDIERVAGAYWSIAECEYLSSVGDIPEAMEHSKKAIEVFRTSGFYKYRVLHALQRQRVILTSAGLYRQVCEAQSELLAIFHKDNLIKSEQMFGSLLDFDLRGVLMAEVMAPPNG